MSKTKLQIVALTDRGMERDHNEDYHGYIADLKEGKAEFLNSITVDALSDLGSLLIVADGMGGTNAGEVASKIAVDVSRDFILAKATALKSVSLSEAKNILLDAVKKAQNEIVQHQKDFPETDGMGTTLVLTWIVKNQAFIVWVGDSRCYGFNPKVGLFQLSKDHSHVQELVDAGKITEEQAFYHPQSNIITQSLGDKKRPPLPGFVEYNLQVGDSILICSDGLNGMVNDSKMEMILQSSTNTELCAKMLLDEANAAGGHDNITVLMAFAENVDSPLPPLKQKKSNSSDENQNNKPNKKDKKLWIGITIGVILTFLVMLAWNYLPNIFGSNNTASDSLKVNNSGKINAQSNSMDSIAWINALGTGTIEAFNNYIEKFKSGIYVKDAEAKIQELKKTEIIKTEVKPKVINSKGQNIKDDSKAIPKSQIKTDSNDNSKNNKSITPLPKDIK